MAEEGMTDAMIARLMVCLHLTAKSELFPQYSAPTTSLTSAAGWVPARLNGTVLEVIKAPGATAGSRCLQAEEYGGDQDYEEGGADDSDDPDYGEERKKKGKKGGGGKRGWC